MYPGMTTSIVGQSGSGKSLTALSILKLLPSRQVEVTDGAIDFLGGEFAGKSEKEMGAICGKEIGMIVSKSDVIIESHIDDRHPAHGSIEAPSASFLERVPQRSA